MGIKQTKHFCLFPGVMILLMASGFALAQGTTTESAGPATQPKSQTNSAEAAPLVFWNRQITVFRSYYDQVSPATRAARAAERLASLPEIAPEWNISANEATSGQYSGVIVSVNDRFAFAILTTDLDQESGETIKAAADHAVAQLRATLEARAQQRQWSVLLKGIGLSVAATLLLIIALLLLVKGGQRALRRLDQRQHADLRELKIIGIDLRPLLHSINRRLTKLTFWAVAIVLLHAWLTFVLLRFPYSQPWGQALGTFIINLFETLFAGILGALPGMFTVVVIFLLTRILTRIVDGFFRQIERGDLKVSWLHKDTATATRRMVTVLVWIFATTIAYPYIPGSNSDAFKGVSVFVGLVVSLGSAGLVNQVMSGLVIVYSRALSVDEFVRIGDDLGTVTEVGTLSTKILTRKHEEITIPNAALVATRMVNYSRHADEGVKVGTTVTIGYDAPWRQIHAMLLHAAEQTGGLRKDPAPFVLQKSLSDFYVEYELVVTLEKPEDRVPVLSELHTHIQDAFNEQGVQIMSPHFMSQPNEKVWVPQSLWFTKSIQVPSGKNGADKPPNPLSNRNDR